jgi:adenylate cyclase
LEGLNKEYRTHILVNESTYAAVKNTGFLFRELDVIRVKGKLQPVTIYELLGKLSELEQETSYKELKQRLQDFAAARQLYRKRDWEQAQHAFQEILDCTPDDGPSRMYWKRCQEYLFDEPPVGWDGVFTMTHK